MTPGDSGRPANPNGYAQLVAWADNVGAVAGLGVGGTGSYGSGLPRFLRRHAHPPTIADIERCTRGGLSKREIIRCLKRYFAREVYRLLPQPGAARNLPSAA